MNTTILGSNHQIAQHTRPIPHHLLAQSILTNIKFVANNHWYSKDCTQILSQSANLEKGMMATEGWLFYQHNGMSNFSQWNSISDLLSCCRSFYLKPKVSNYWSNMHDKYSENTIPSNPTNNYRQTDIRHSNTVTIYTSLPPVPSINPTNKRLQHKKTDIAEHLNSHKLHTLPLC